MMLKSHDLTVKYIRRQCGSPKKSTSESTRSDRSYFSTVSMKRLRHRE